MVRTASSVLIGRREVTKPSIAPLSQLWCCGTQSCVMSWVHAAFVLEVSRWNGSNTPAGGFVVFAGSGCWNARSEEHTSELQSHSDLVCRLLLEKKKNKNYVRLRVRRTLPATSPATITS